MYIEAMAKRPITIQLEPTLIQRIDSARGEVPRQQWIADRLEEALLRLGSREANDGA